MKTRIAAFADHVNMTADGKLNVIGVFSTIWSKEFPAVHSRAYLVLQFEIGDADVGDHSLSIQLRDPAKAMIHEIKGSFVGALDPNGSKAVAVVQAEYVNLRLPSEGLYEARVIVDNKTIERVGVLVRKRA